MKFNADLHIHSKYSRATAKNLDFENLYYAAQVKGLTVVGTGDFTYPAWIEEIESKLEETEPGMFSLKKQIADKIDKTVPENCRQPVRFILQTEISSIYKKDDRVRKNHNLIYFPDIDSVKKFNARLDAIGNITSDGRPILGLDAADLLSIMLETNENGFFVPAHIWTPWFSMFGSKSGFDSMEACFGSLKKYIFAVETGLSSDPPMNWRVKDLDNVRLISNSDAHSPGYLGRNASVFDTDLSFFHIRNALEANDLEKYKGTLDMYPHQGKYHYDGHRKCNVCLNPATTRDIEGICPECGKKVTCGVLNRVQELASRPEGYQPDHRHGYKSIIPLTDILSEIFEVGPKTKKVTTNYDKAIETLGPELGILLDKSFNEIETAGIPLLAEAVKKMRSGDINISPGYDGEFGKVNLFSKQEKAALKGEKYVLFNLPQKRKKAVPSKAAEVKKKQKIKRKKQSSPPPLKKPVTRDLLASLNPEQKKAVESQTGAIIIQAGPGTGKTRTLTARIAHLIVEKKIDPSNVLALTFTNKAAKELVQRLEKNIPTSRTPVLAATFHGFCLKLLKEFYQLSASIAGDTLKISLLQEAMGESGKKGRSKKYGDLIALCKQELRGPNDDLKRVAAGKEIDDPYKFRHIYKTYQDLCRENDLIDFEDLILFTNQMLTDNEQILAKVRHRYPYIFVDEYQDLNFGQYELVKKMSQDGQVFVIGDPDQSIYGFRGSDNKYFKQFSDDFPGCEKFMLTKNYRSTKTILNASCQMISKSEEAKGKYRIYSDLDTTRKLIIKETASGKAEAVAIGKMIEKLVGGTSFYSMDTGAVASGEKTEYSFSDFAILYRTGRQCETFIDVFEKEGIPYQTANKKDMLEVQGIRQLISLCRIMAGCEHFDDMEIIFDHFGVQMGKKTKTDCRKAYRKAKRSSRKTLKSFFETDLAGVGPEVRQRLVHILEKLASFKQETAGLKNEDSLHYLCEKAGIKKVIDEKNEAKQYVEKLLIMAAASDGLKDFLNSIALNQDVDTIEFNTEKVSLMTMHAAKGLEFPVVFIAGCEKGLVPYARDGESVEDLEEERRLFYVAMTRAMDILCLTYAKKRRIYGTGLKRQRSLFIEDIEKELTQVETMPFRMSSKKKEKQMELF